MEKVGFEIFRKTEGDRANRTKIIGQEEIIAKKDD